MNIATSILLSLCGLALTVCLVYTMASPVVQQGFNNVGEAVDSLVGQATDAMAPVFDGSEGETFRDPGFFERIGEFFTGLFKGASSAVSSPTPSTPLPQTQSSFAPETLSVNSFSDPYMGQAYLMWRNAVADPLVRVMVGTGATAEVLEGIAAGSSSARAVLIGLSDAELNQASSNIAAYRTTVLTTGVPQDLPNDVKVQVSSANDAALTFCNRAQTLIDDARAARGGSAVAEGEMSGVANEMIQAANTMNTCMSTAEALMGVVR